MISFLEKTIDSLKNRKTCGEIMVPFEKLFYRTKKDSVRSTLEQMRKISYGHVPVLDEKKRVFGVFTAVSFLNIMADRKGEPLPLEFNFFDAEKYIAFDHHDSEVYRFVKTSLFVDELKDIFENTYSGGKRLAMVFVTANGKPEEKLLGIISPWDVLGK